MSSDCYDHIEVVFESIISTGPPINQYKIETNVGLQMGAKLYTPYYLVKHYYDLLDKQNSERGKDVARMK